MDTGTGGVDQSATDTGSAMDSTDSNAPDTTPAQDITDTASTPDVTLDVSDTTDSGRDMTMVASCEEISAQGCLANRDCGATEVCTVFDAEIGVRCCEEGTAGVGLVGDACEGAAECAFGRCEARDDGAKFCSGACAIDEECPLGFYCSDLFGWCAPRDVDVAPASCGEVGLSQCFNNDNCFLSERCEDLGDVDEVLCCTVGARGVGAAGDACVSGLECAYGRCLDGACTAACDFETPCPNSLICDDLRGLCVVE